MAQKRIVDRRSEYNDDINKIKPEEIRFHNVPEDAWIVIHGIVYDVTEYLAFHPGGRENMMLGVGLEDATHLFNEVHPWVNYDKILTKHFVGHVYNKQETMPDVGVVRFLAPESSSESTTSRLDVMEVRQYVVRDVERFVDFGCIQMDDIVFLTFDTGKYGNPFFEIRKPFENRWTFVISYPEMVFVYKFIPMRMLIRPPRFKIFYDTGIIEIGFQKLVEERWPSCGDMICHRRKFITPMYSKKYVIKEHVSLNKYTFMVSLQKKDQSICNAPLGSYIILNNDVNERRAYNPVPYFFIRGSQEDIRENYNNSLFTLLVRRYTDGRLSSYLYSKKVGDTILGSEPSGSFDLQLIEDKDMFVFLAGGVGVTPFLGIIQFLLEKTQLPAKKMMLVMFNPTLQHQFLQDKFEILRQDKRFAIYYVLTDPPSDYTGLRGHITAKLLRALLDKQFHEQDLPALFFLVCGPPKFLAACNEQFSLLEIQVFNTFFFQPNIEASRDSMESDEFGFQDMDDLPSRDTTDMNNKQWRRSMIGKESQDANSREAGNSGKLKYCQIL